MAMLKIWLHCTERQACEYDLFEVIDATHSEELSEEVVSHMKELLVDELFDPEFLADIAQILGWTQVEQLIIGDHLPQRKSIKRGDFGETLINAILEQFYDYSIPVRKLRFKVTGNQTLPSTDSLAIKLEENNTVADVCFVESKLRTNVDNKVAIDGYNQLERDYSYRLPDILRFVASRLHSEGHPLYNPFTRYLRDRKDTSKNIDNFRLSLCLDVDSANETCLANLNDVDIQLEPLRVHFILLKDLRNLTDKLFSEIGFEEVDDGD